MKRWHCPRCCVTNRPLSKICGTCGAAKPMAVVKLTSPKSNLCRKHSKSCDPAATKSDLEKATKKIMAKVSTLAASLTALTTQVTKAKDEVIAKIAALEAALGDVELPAEAEAALESLKSAVQAVDDINPDATPTT